MTAAPALQPNREDIVELLERQARQRLGRSAGEILRDYREGHLENPGDVAALLILADLLPDYDPLFAAA
ncbi:MAG: hypothetical protein ACRDGN_08250 [bacterium]